MRPLDRLREVSRRAAKVGGEIGRAAFASALQSEPVRRRVDEARQLYAEAQKIVDERLREVEADLRGHLNKLKAEAERLQRQARRAEHASEHYRTLGVAPGATVEQVKAAWRDQMRACHPDRFANDPAAEAGAHARSLKVNKAYEELTALLTGREDRRAD